MLVLGRTTQEGENVIWVGETKITLCGYKGRTVLIGIEAPQDVLILRGELKDQPHTPKKGTPLAGRVRAPRGDGEEGTA